MSRKGYLYNVYYKDSNNKMQCACYFGYSKDDAERLFNSESRMGEKIVKIERKA